jgi:hypothetical protein
VIAFWEWWNSEGHTVDPTKLSAMTDQMSSRVNAIHDGLAWHFSAGSESVHRLTVSGAGAAELRPLAARWLRAAPPASATWEFRASQEADPRALTNVLTIAGERLDLLATRFHIESDPDDLRLDVGVFHPGFLILPQDGRMQVIFLVLDWLLGEDDVERWVGNVEVLVDAADASQKGADLIEAVASIRLRQDPDEWTLAQWEDESGAHGLASFRRALRWVDHPTLDAHNVIRASYTSQENGLPVDTAELESLRALEAELEGDLSGLGILVGHVSLDGHRTFHVYTDSEDQNAGARLAEWASLRGVELETTRDPAWRNVRHFTG